MKKPIALMFIGMTVCFQPFAQSSKDVDTKVPKNWHQLDKTETGFQGVSLSKAYDFLRSKKFTSKKITVAVIDSGIDTLHEDLKPILWKNPKEVPGNNKDDDNNGYVDDVHGWNFIGGRDGRNVKEDSYEGARVYYRLKPIWDEKNVDEFKLSTEEKKSYQTFLRAKSKIVGVVDDAEASYMSSLYPTFLQGDSVLRKEMGKDEYNGTDLQAHSTSNSSAKMVRGMMLSISMANDSYDITNKQLIDEISGQIRKAQTAKTPPPAYRGDIVKDDESKLNDRAYGNNDIMASTPFHGTHCAGIIGAARNGVGIDGIADNVSIMVLRAVPDGDEHDKDIANAIRYAVDNGAKIISMSFGKDFSPEKKWVDEAFKYAEKKGVLLVHAAGNDAKNIDTAFNFPNPIFEDGTGKASNVITVGASGDEKNGGITASFSNYGKSEVDVFAPGVSIYSTIPGGNTYGNSSGTSMACPVVSGIAAIVWGYFPNLTASEVKMVIEKSVVFIEDQVPLPGTKDMVKLGDISKTGGIVNALRAVTMASEIKKPSQVKKK